MQVQDIMTDDVACCSADTNLGEVAQMMVENDCGAIPVVENVDGRQVVGVITDRDIVVRAVAKGMNPLTMNADSIMSTPVVVVRPGENLQECLRAMEENQVRRVPVVDENGRCVGIVAQADVALHAGEQSTGQVVEEISRPTPAASRADPTAPLRG